MGQLLSDSMMANLRRENPLGAHMYAELAAGTLTISRNVLTKVSGMSRNVRDSHGGWNNNDTYTVQPGQGGRYLWQAYIFWDFTNTGGDGETWYMYPSVNASARERVGTVSGVATWDQPCFGYSTVLDVNEGDTMELYTLVADSNGADARILGGATYASKFMVQRLG